MVPLYPISLLSRLCYLFHTTAYIVSYLLPSDNLRCCVDWWNIWPWLRGCTTPAMQLHTSRHQIMISLVIDPMLQPHHSTAHDVQTIILYPHIFDVHDDFTDFLRQFSKFTITIVWLFSWNSHINSRCCRICYLFFFTPFYLSCDPFLMPYCLSVPALGKRIISTSSLFWVFSLQAVHPYLKRMEAFLQSIFAIVIWLVGESLKTG